MYKISVKSALLCWGLATHRNSQMKKPSRSDARSTTPSTLRDQRNAQIRADYTRLYASGQRSAFIIIGLSERYFLAEDTIERIVFQRGHYRSEIPVTTQFATA